MHNRKTINHLGITIVDKEERVGFDGTPRRMRYGEEQIQERTNGSDRILSDEQLAQHQ